MKRRDKINYYLDIAETVRFRRSQKDKPVQPDITVLPEEESTVPIRETVSAIP